VFVWNGTEWIGAAQPPPPETLEIAATSATKLEGHTGNTDFTFTVTRTGGLTETTAVEWSVSGSGTNQATADDFAEDVQLSDVLIFAPGETSKTITVTVAGDNDKEANEGFAVRLTFAPAGVSIINGTATGLIKNDDASLRIAASSAVKLEGNTTTTDYTFLVTRSGYLTQATTVDWAVGGSGTNPASADDFLNGAFPTGSVTFASGETTQLITVKAAGDSSYEPNEGFTVTLSNPAAGSSITRGSATGLIQNDDARLSIAATSANQVEGNTGTATPFTFTVKRSGYLTQATTANWAVTGAGNNAANGSDFTGGSLPTGTISFATGETSKTITVNVNGDSTVERAENFTVTLSDPSPGAVITTASATGTIQADDVASTGSDQFEGGAGVDTFNGLAGDDVFIGGGGADRLTGGLARIIHDPA